MNPGLTPSPVLPTTTPMGPSLRQGDHCGGTPSCRPPRLVLLCACGGSTMGLLTSAVQTEDEAYRGRGAAGAASEGRQRAGSAPAQSPGLWLSPAAPETEGTHTPQTGVTLEQRDTDQKRVSSLLTVSSLPALSRGQVPGHLPGRDPGKYNCLFCNEAG